MIKIENLVGRKVEYKEISFKDAIDIITLKIHNCTIVKTISVIPNEKGLGFHQVSKWENVNYEWFNNNFVISEIQNSIAINEDANILIMERNNILTVSFEDYHLQLIIS